MKKIHPRNIHIGNQGEHIVARKLSAHCIVRDVGQGKDTGIDLYCEIVNDETRELSLHFFCQVKTVKEGTFDKSKTDKYLDYWSNQPVPVFVVVVEYREEKDIEGTHELWVYDIPFVLVKRDAKALGKREPLRHLKEKFRLCSESEDNDIDKRSLRNFIDGHVSFAYGLWQLRRFGLVLPNPEVKKSKVPVIPGGLSDLYGEEIARVAEYAKLYLEKDR